MGWANRWRPRGKQLSGGGGVQRGRRGRRCGLAWGAKDLGAKMEKCGADARREGRTHAGEGKKVDQVFVSTSYFLGVEDK
jgi:hypothetical protein